MNKDKNFLDIQDDWGSIITDTYERGNSHNPLFKLINLDDLANKNNERIGFKLSNVGDNNKLDILLIEEDIATFNCDYDRLLDYMIKPKLTGINLLGLYNLEIPVDVNFDTDNYTINMSMSIGIRKRANSKGVNDYIFKINVSLDNGVYDSIPLKAKSKTYTPFGLSFTRDKLYNDSDSYKNYIINTDLLNYFKTLFLNDNIDRQIIDNVFADIKNKVNIF